MKVQELYDYITKNMTAEQALMKFLEGHAKTYKLLKFNEGEEIHPEMLIVMAALDNGWSMAVSNTEDPTETLNGIVVGTPEYLASVFGDDEPHCSGGCGNCGCC